MGEQIKKYHVPRDITGSGSVVEIRSGGQQFEYDILAISEDKRRIILADAKFRDMVFSSFTGDNLIRQELLGPNALRFEANRQQLRLNFFKENPESFSGCFSP